MSDFYFSNIVLIQGTFTVLLLALSIQIQFRMGVFSFAGAAFYGMGSYGVAIFVLHYGFDAISALLAVVVICAVVGYLLSLVVQRLSGLYLAMATVAFVMIVTVVAHNGGDLTGGSVGLFGVITPVEISVPHLAVVCGIAVGAMILSERGRMGRRIEAVREDPELASAMGINVARYRKASFVFSGVLGALGGGLNILMMTAIAPENIGFPLIVLALTIIIVGGSRSWLGVLIGALIFTWLPVVLEQVGTYQSIVYGVIVALAAIFMPGGITGIVTDLYRKRVARLNADALDSEEAREQRAVEQDAEAAAELAGSGPSTVTAGGKR
ncbi:branched-chain amino acid ABC transporter permease [Rhodococcus chondri]|uniref:Branched-chain amino acid ABC transporter permease n=1 Tax=Rhodococcus chondri TaxID=3065941 RepID=A0ABU7JKN6_9NOCA|nr:branched-chain amino acid ABC transporter permease [Rhodococcus sp. CC-R104]MEE2030603.1 branched-chain amino acid ABC transporter permease [Rhodococcus sp. CC-R104]